MRKKPRTRGFGTRGPVPVKPARPRWHFALALVIGAGGAAATAAVSFGAAWAPPSASAPELRAAVPADLPPPMPEDEPFDMAAAPMPMPTVAPVLDGGVRDIRAYKAVGTVSMGTDWLYDPSLPVSAPSGHQQVASASAADQLPPIPLSAPPKEVTIARGVPLPPADPRGAGRAAPDAGPAIDAGDIVAAAPLPQKKPEFTETKVRLASLSTGEDDLGIEPPQASPAQPGEIPMSSDEVRLPTSADRFAVYDIVGQVVYMPDGTKFEAHSGYGEKFDNPRYVSVKMLGPTPPNTYRLTMREALFHGVEALRMTPVGKEAMYGRNGILTHTYLLGARGDSNGCISFKDYDAFLAHFKKGKIDHMVVVARLPASIKPKGSGSMFAWLKPKSAPAD